MQKFHFVTLFHRIPESGDNNVVNRDEEAFLQYIDEHPIGSAPKIVSSPEETSSEEDVPVLFEDLSGKSIFIPEKLTVPNEGSETTVTQELKKYGPKSVESDDSEVISDSSDENSHRYIRANRDEANEAWIMPKESVDGLAILSEAEFTKAVCEQKLKDRQLEVQKKSPGSFTQEERRYEALMNMSLLEKSRILDTQGMGSETSPAKSDINRQIQADFELAAELSARNEIDIIRQDLGLDKPSGQLSDDSDDSFLKISPIY